MRMGRHGDGPPWGCGCGRKRAWAGRFWQESGGLPKLIMIIALAETAAKVTGAHKPTGESVVALLV